MVSRCVLDVRIFYISMLVIFVHQSASVDMLTLADGPELICSGSIPYAIVACRRFERQRPITSDWECLLSGFTHTHQFGNTHQTGHRILLAMSLHRRRIDT